MYIYLDTIFLFFLFFFKVFRRKHLFVTIKRNIPTLIYTILISRLKGTNKASNWERTLFLHIVKKNVTVDRLDSCFFFVDMNLLARCYLWRCHDVSTKKLLIRHHRTLASVLIDHIPSLLGPDNRGLAWISDYGVLQIIYIVSVHTSDHYQIV